MRRPYERTYDERGGFAYCVERPELDPHREKVGLLTMRRSMYQRSVVAVGRSKDER